VPLAKDFANPAWARLAGDQLLAQQEPGGHALAWRIIPAKSGAQAKTEGSQGVERRLVTDELSSAAVRIDLPPGEDLRSLMLTTADGQMVAIPRTKRPASLWTLTPGRPALQLASAASTSEGELALVAVTGLARVAIMSPGADVRAGASREPSAAPPPTS